jgi:hypothetical protein
MTVEGVSSVTAVRVVQEKDGEQDQLLLLLLLLCCSARASVKEVAHYEC